MTLKLTSALSSEQYAEPVQHNINHCPSRRSTDCSPWVLIFKDDRAAKRPVNLGLRGNAAVEILGGLSLGDVVIPQNSGVVTGQRIRAVLQ